MKRLVLTAFGGAMALGAVMLGTAFVAVDEAHACPTFRGNPHFGSVRLDEGFLPDPWNRRVTAGGQNEISNCGVGGWGWTARRPDYRIQYSTSGSSALTFIIQSNVDTVLLVNDPNGRWHFDDDGGADLGAALRIGNAPSGQYDIWIGSYNRGSGIPANLQISERY
ncbi:MAG: peptidase S1 [Pseudomonadota bacterium]